MTTIIIRSKNSSGGGFSLSDDARRRAREHLKSLGYRDEELRPIVWPDDAVSAYRKHRYAPWQYTTRADVRRKRQEDAKHVLWFKREYGVSQRRALYVWVFWCPGINNFIFRGWWIDLVGRGIDFSCKYFEGTKMCSKLMELFPLVGPTLYSPPDIDEWKAEFVKRYQRGRWCGKPQGKAPIWAEVQGGSIKRLLSRAEWLEASK